MKATELMVGDWVLDGKKPAQITGIMCDDLFETTLSPSVGGECISPIPLTEEILAKNGFHKSMPYNDWTNDNVNLILTEYAYGYNVQNTSIVLNCIHELQHAMRLCGIEKEVKL